MPAGPYETAAGPPRPAANLDDLFALSGLAAGRLGVRCLRECMVIMAERPKKPSAGNWTSWTLPQGRRRMPVPANTDGSSYPQPPGINPAGEASLLLAEAAYLKVEADWERSRAIAEPSELSPACRELSPFGR